MLSHNVWKTWPEGSASVFVITEARGPCFSHGMGDQDQILLVQRWNQRSQTWQKESRTTVVAAQRWPHKNECYSGKVQGCARDQKKLFEIIKSLTKPLQQEQYPDSDSLKDLADASGDLFIMKIQKIRAKLDSQAPEPITIPRVPVKEEDMILSLLPLTGEDVRKLIKQSPHRQSSSDSIPTWLWKECLDSILHVLTLLVNKSLQIGYFRKSEKFSSQTSSEKARPWTCFPKFQTSK